MSEQQKSIVIEYTDRYGGRVPSSLRICRGDCEGMGFFPHKVDTALNRTGFWVQGYRDGHTESFKIGEDGYAWVKCPDCNGTGRVPFWKSLLRIPWWLWKGFRFYRVVRQFDPELSFGKSLELWLWCAFIVDIKDWRN